MITARGRLRRPGVGEEVSQQLGEPALARGRAVDRGPRGRALYDTLRMEPAQDGEPIAVSTVLPAAIDTPFFEHARSELGAMPVYAPELVADAIVRTAEHPRREVPVGGAAVGFVAGQRLSPALTDALMSIRRFGVRESMAERPDNGRDNLDERMDERGWVHGTHAGRVLRRSPITQVLRRVPRPGELLTVAIATARRSNRILRPRRRFLDGSRSSNRGWGPTSRSGFVVGAEPARAPGTASAWRAATGHPALVARTGANRLMCAWYPGSRAPEPLAGALVPSRAWSRSPHARPDRSHAHIDRTAMA